MPELKFIYVSKTGPGDKSLITPSSVASEALDPYWQVETTIKPLI